MAAYAALLSLESVIDQTLSEIQYHLFFRLNDNDHDPLPLCDKNQLNSLHRNVISLQKVFEEIPEKCLTLEGRIRIVAFQLEDIIESSISGPPFMYFACEVDNLSRKQMCSAFVNFAQEIDLIVEEIANVENYSKLSDKLAGYLTWTTSSLIGARGGNDTMVGFNEDLNEILDRATGQERALQIIPIVGMGGIGKTTLARNVFEHQLMIEKFDVRFWVTVSQEYNVQEILLELLSCKGQSEEDVESLIERLYKSLKGRRFLIVLDDMWHSEMWYKVRRAFPNCKNGSRIIITSRLLEMVREVNSTSVFHHMKFLNEEQSWYLFCEKVFGRECCPHELENIGKKIASNCKGLPLAIVVIGGLLKVKLTVDYWEEIAKNVIELAASNDQLLGILSLSYANLPYHMRSCFLYMGVFPEDFRIPSSQLIQLLVSEGFVKPNGPKSMEEVAEEYLKDLASRNLLLLQQNRRFETLYSIHDILRELSMRKAQEESFHQHCKHMDETNFQKIVKGQRRIIVHPNNFNFLPNSPIRSMLYFDPYFDSLLEFTSKFKLLKMVYGLKVREEDISSPGSIIFELIHLRFLGMELLGAYVDIYWAHLHESIIKLHNLRTLRIVSRCRVVLPWHIWRMPKLKHLDVSWSYISLLPGVPHYVQTLSGVRNFKFSMDVIQNFPYLKILKILYAYEVYRYDSEVSCMDWTKYCLNNLVHLHHLEELEFKFKKDFFDNKEHFPRDLAFPHNLKRLTLDNIRIPCERMSQIGSLLNLEVLILYDCTIIGDEWEQNEGEFLGLKHLQLQRLHLEKWNTEETHFPRLEELFLSECSFEIPSSIGDVPTLDKLTVDCCDNMTIESARRIEEEQLSYGNDKLQIVIKMPGRKQLPKKKVERKTRSFTSSKDQGFKSWIKKVHRSVCCSPPEDRDNLLWHKDLGQHCSGEFSMAVVQANNMMEDQSHLESGCLSSNNSGPYGTFVGVYDGHGGPETSEFINEHLFPHLKSFTAEHQSMSVEVIQKAFQATEDGFLSIVTRQWPVKPQIAAAGSGCLVGIICGGTLYIANLGESHAVLGRISIATGEVSAIQLSEVHHASIESVRQELRSLHPDDPNIVVLKHNIWRVKGMIQISRSIGDVYLKRPEFNRDPLYPKFLLREPFRRPILSSEPSVTVHQLVPQDLFIIFASDGLWEYLSNQEAVDLVQHHPRNGIAKRLVRAAFGKAAKKRDMKYSDLERIGRGVRRHFHDDITVIVVFLDSNLISKASSVQTPNVSVKGNGVILPPNSPDTYTVMETESVAY